MSETKVPASPFGVKLRGRREIAEYYLQDTSPQALRRVSALLGEVRVENRLPHSVDGDGEPVSFTSWLDAFTLARAKNLPAEIQVAARLRGEAGAEPPHTHLAAKPE